MQISSVKEAPIHASSSHVSVRRLIFSTALGNGLEIFDFTVYSFFAAYIGGAFFPATDPLSSLLFAVGTFGAGFFARPIGAIILGGYADRVGRRAAMSLSILLMAMGTCIIALCPTFMQIGLAAPVLVLGGRILQGFAAGGEIGAATTYLMESNALNRRGFMVSWQLVSQGVAATVGALCGFALNRVMDPQALASWGWRLPFLLGMLIAPVGFYIRRHLPEDRPNVSFTATRVPIVELLANHRSRMIKALLLTTGNSVTMYVVVFFMPSYLTRVMHFPGATGFGAAIASSVMLTVFAFLGGLLADRLKKRKPIVVWTSVINLLCVLPAFWMVVHASSPMIIVTAVGFMSCLLGAGVVATLLLLMEMFPPTLRATGFATSYAIANTLFGGTAQFVVTALIAKTSNAFSAAWYVFACDMLAFVALLCIREGDM